MLIGLTGRIASGKGVVVEYLKTKGFEYTTISQVVREEAAKINIPITRESLQDLGNLVRKYEGPGAWIKRIIKRTNINGNYIIDGIRNPGEIEELRKVSGFVLISVDCPQETRFQRVILRNKASDAKTWGAFLQMDERDFGVGELENGQQVGKCMALADYKLTNNSTIENFYAKIDIVYNEIRENKKC